jgi:hypothetical protein
MNLSFALPEAEVVGLDGPLPTRWTPLGTMMGADVRMSEMPAAERSRTPPFPQFVNGDAAQLNWPAKGAAILQAFTPIQEDDALAAAILAQTSLPLNCDASTNAELAPAPEPVAVSE